MRPATKRENTPERERQSKREHTGEKARRRVYMPESKREREGAH